MGLLGSRKKDVDTRGAVARAADAQPDDSALGRVSNKLIGRLLDVGIDGKGPLEPARDVADKALAKHGSPDAAVASIVRSHKVIATAGGFVTGLGGFFTMPVSLPANVVEFYVVATRMVAATARVRGYDIDDPHIRTAILLTLVGADSDDILKKVGLGAVGGKVTSLAARRLPAPALMVLNKAIGFRLLARAGQSSLARFGRGVPIVGGGIGAGLDLYLLGRVAEHAQREFPRIKG